MKKRKKEKKLPVLLLEDIPNLGQRGEVVKVRPGYFRYLVSLGKVTLATKERLEGELKSMLLSSKIEERKVKVESLKEEIEKLVLEFKIKKGEKGQIFNPVTKEKIIKALEEKGIEISRSQIELKGKIEKEGEYEIIINLGYDIKAILKIKVTS
ncbi:MAG: 50S ribosomal protein L9 [Minisyncoccia bacterium]|jgi:large subunit ribosomal protein L9